MHPPYLPYGLLHPVPLPLLDRPERNLPPSPIPPIPSTVPYPISPGDPPPSILLLRHKCTCPCSHHPPLPFSPQHTFCFPGHHAAMLEQAAAVPGSSFFYIPTPVTPEPDPIPSSSIFYLGTIFLWPPDVSLLSAIYPAALTFLTVPAVSPQLLECMLQDRVPYPHVGGIKSITQA